MVKHQMICLPKFHCSNLDASYKFIQRKILRELNVFAINKLNVKM
jgi:hypothetical protein